MVVVMPAIVNVPGDMNCRLNNGKEKQPLSYFRITTVETKQQ